VYFLFFLLLILASLFLYGFIRKGVFYSYCMAALARRNVAKPNFFQCVAIVLMDRAVMALAIYRLNYKIGNPFVGRFLTNFGHLLTGVEIYFNAELGSGFQLWHGQGTVIGQNSKVGKNTLILHQVTLGSGFVVVGNGVKIGCGAKLLGNIEVGDGCVISANAVVTKDVPPGKLVKIDGTLLDIDENKEIIFGTRLP